MRTILNLIWFFLGGFFMGIGWCIAGFVMAISIVGLPWARASFLFGSFCLMPFGREAVDRGTGTLGFLGNVVWFVLFGWWLALGHVASAIANFATIIGIPFGVQHLKLAWCAIAPIGKEVVTKEEARRYSL